MLYSNHPHFSSFVQPAADQSFSLFTDEIEILYNAAKKSGKQELTQIMERLYTYSRQKTSRNNGPVKFRFK